MRAGLGLLVALSLGFAPAPFPKTMSTPARRSIVGTWENKNNSLYLLTVTASTMRYGNPNGPDLPPYKVTFDVTTNPKRYGVSSGGRSKYVGIYRIENGVLTLQYRPAHRPYPTSFDEGDCYRETYVRKRD